MHFQGKTEPSIELAVISDAHFRGGSDVKLNQFYDLVNEFQAAGVKQLVLLGDIFDFYLGGRRFFKQEYEVFYHSLLPLLKSGTQVFFFEGNHEFHLSPQDWPGIQIINEGGMLLTLSSGKRVKLAHGDLVHNTFAYRIFRGFLKSKLVHLLSKLVPARFINAYAMQHATASRKADVYRSLDHRSLLGSVFHWIQHLEPTADIGIFGHFHVPYYEQLPGAKLAISLSSWQSPNALICQSGKFSRVELNLLEKNWQKLECRPTQFLS